MSNNYINIDKKIQKQLVDHNIINETQLKEALKVQEAHGESLADILVRLKYIKREHLMKFVSQTVGIPYVKLERSLVDPDVLKIVPGHLVAKYNLIPVLKLADTLTVALTDPFNLNALEELRSATGLEIEPLLCDEADIKNAMSYFYSKEDFTSKKEDITSPAEAKQPEPKLKKDDGAPTQVEVSPDIRLTQSFPDIGLISDIDDRVEQAEKAKQDEERSPVVKITNLMLRQAINQGASDIHIEPQKEKLHIRYRIDGVLRTVHILSKELARLFISRIKIMSRLNISERRLPQDGSFTLKLGDKEIDGRVATSPTVYGESAVIKLLNQTKDLMDIGNLGMSVDMKNKFQDIIDQSSGMILVTGPAGSGKTTTLYAALNEILSDKIKIITIENPVEHRIQGLTQIQVYRQIDLNYARVLHSVLQQDPDVILVGELRDKETAQLSVQAVLTGRLVFSTMHTTGCVDSILRLIDLGIEHYYVRDVLSLVIAQRLVRKLCPECREMYSPDGQELDEDSLSVFSSDDNIYRPIGCDVCGNTGYNGRIPIFEMLSVNDDVKKVIKAETDRSELFKAALNTGMVSLWESAVDAVKNGITSLQEVKSNIPRR